MTKLAIPGFLGCRRACDIKDLNWVLRQPIFEPLSDIRIAGGQMNQGLVCFFANSTFFFDPSVSSDVSENKKIASLSRTFRSVR
jgi:hypothetical protein